MYIFSSVLNQTIFVICLVLSHRLIYQINIFYFLIEDLIENIDLL